MSYLARILADSINLTNQRLCTFEITFPRIVLAELNTHRQLSRNSASSRAIPTKDIIKRVEDNPFIPEKFPRIGRGMQPDGWITREDNREEYEREVMDWLDERDYAVVKAKGRLERGLGKQIINRPLEVFMWHTVIVSATAYENFFNLRCHPDAQLEIRRIAEMMRDLYREHKPILKQPGEWHTPFVHPQDTSTGIIKEKITGSENQDCLLKVSSARCARVSYMRHTQVSSFDVDINLCEKLRASKHMSPFEHVAQALEDDRQVRNFSGWKQYRVQIEEEDKYNSLI